MEYSTKQSLETNALQEAKTTYLYSWFIFTQWSMKICLSGQILSINLKPYSANQCEPTVFD